MLLDSKRVHEPLRWLTKLYFVSYAASQVLPTVIGGDAVRIAAHVRRRPDAKSEAAAAVLMERVVGSAGTTDRRGHRPPARDRPLRRHRALVWLECLRRRPRHPAGPPLLPPRERLLQSRESGRRLARGFQSVWQALHTYRHQPAALATVLGVTLLVQISRILAIWLCGRPMGSTVAGRLRRDGAAPLPDHDGALHDQRSRRARGVLHRLPRALRRLRGRRPFAAGFLFYAVTIATAIPGSLILLWESVRPTAARRTANAPSSFSACRGAARRSSRRCWTRTPRSRSDGVPISCPSCSRHGGVSTSRRSATTSPGSSASGSGA